MSYDPRDDEDLRTPDKVLEPWYEDFDENTGEPIVWEDCPICGGDGLVWGRYSVDEELCSPCNGTGSVRVNY